MFAPEDNPADDVQPTKEEWAEYERPLTIEDYADAQDAAEAEKNDR